MLANIDLAQGNSSLPKSQTSLAYETLRNDIVAGVHAPGQKLKIQDLADELKVAPGAVREALSRLVADELVISRDQRGFLVAPLSLDDLADLTELRCEIEAIALRRSLARGTIDWEAQVLSAAHRLRPLPQPAPGKGASTSEWVVRHAQFHAALISACGSPRLIKLHAKLYEQSERYRIMSALIEATRDVAGEHDRIAELALARDVDGLIAATTTHMRATTTLIIEAARRQGMA
jgi:GntR family transcriptional regulator, carbon starvation induced regulator